MPNVSLSALQVKNIGNITRNELVNSLEFLKFFQNIYIYITLIVFSFLGNKMYKFYHILLIICKGVSKPFIKYFVKFQKTKYDGVRDFLLSKIASSIQFSYCSC